jgi:hypothetical protein
MNQTHAFGVEIEFTTDMWRSDIVELLSGIGIEAQSEEYGIGTRDYWKVVEDGSVEGGWELVSPILYGQNGIDEVVKVVEALKTAGCDVDHNCGFHVHVNAGDLSGASILNTLLRYAKHEGRIDNVVPGHRRDNGYCYSVRDLYRPLVAFLNQNPRCLPAVAAGKQESRYSKLNIQAFLKHGTIEFRQHEGTLHAPDISHWIRFCVQFVEDSIVEVVDNGGVFSVVVKQDDGAFANLPPASQRHFNDRAMDFRDF